MNTSDTLEIMHSFARKYKGNSEAAEALMSFCRGECQHHFDSDPICELCGEDVVQSSLQSRES